MKQNNIRILQEFLITQINYYIFFPFGLTIATLFKSLIAPERPSLLIWALGGLVPFSFYFVRRKVKGFVPLVMSHLLGIGIFVLLANFLSSQSNIVNCVYFILVGIGFTIYSISLRFHSDNFADKSITMPFAVGFVAVSLLLQHYLGDENLDFYYTAIIILVLAGYFLNYYLTEYLNFLVVNASSTGILPEKEIFSSGIRLTFLYTLASVVVLICTSQFSWLKDILMALLKIIVFVLQWIFHLFPEGSTEELTLKTSEAGNNDNSMLFAEQQNTLLIWKILEVIAGIALVTGILFALYFALRNLISFIREMIKKRGTKYQEIVMAEAVDVREKCEIRKNKVRRKNPFAFRGFPDAKEKIRRIYKKHVSSYAEERLSYHTAREMEGLMTGGAFASIYEKARYSDEVCTPQDVRLMKDACK